ncbi:4-hydroxy-tetrahydrodipicolinate reductase [Natronomonas salina]|uniref:4-hydroxy-tetrahydrodipicolinate reductase n=1 Tax=Natronomonas salina TaxID=1710540 RepID=UPI0015B78B18|nr:4-hydroxy-tetrahydrodipicolinate reductase [Natronomonas salina]QLD88722.1 4-hydroxy-tetrahydrodipicolinate reductase [Natronomonas salina]
MRLVVIGATGRTGGEIVAEASDRGHDVVGVATEAATIESVDVHPSDDLAEVLEGADAAIDFTVPDASREHAALAAEAGVPYVVGTTGFDEQGMSTLREASESVPVLKASNFARGVQALLQVVEAGVEALPGYDVELTETHHNGKRDAPSGTANTILDVVDEAREESLDRTHGREGEHLRDESEVGVHVRRAGNVRGEHEVMLAGNDEVVTLTHRAESRRVFAAGAVDAAEWLAGREAGWYDFADAL